MPAPPPSRALPPGFRVRLDPRVRIWADGSVIVGGAPWRISRIEPAVRDLVRRLVDAGRSGLTVDSPIDRTAARALLDRGFAHPLLRPAPRSAAPVDLVIPAMDHPHDLDRLLASLEPARATVVDDGSTDPSSIARVAADHGARLIRHATNQGPSAARNTGLAAASSDVVAFIDSDCTASPDWAARLVEHFEDPAVAAVAPRVTPTTTGATLLERYEATRSALDMGRRPELVRPGARLGFVPSAALVVRRSVIAGVGFDEGLRLGEDVDLVWRLVDAGWLVQYDPSVVVAHRTRDRPWAWLRRRFEYGTSAPDLDARHPGRLVPARVSSWNLAVLTLVADRRYVAATAVASSAALLLARPLAGLPRHRPLAAYAVGKGLVADGAAVGHLFRREWWPLGAVALAASTRSRAARTIAVLMIAPLAWEWITARPGIDPARYVLMRLADDAAYGSGVIAAAVGRRRLAPLIPRVRLPRLLPQRLR